MLPSLIVCVTVNLFFSFILVCLSQSGVHVSVLMFLLLFFSLLSCCRVSVSPAFKSQVLLFLLMLFSFSLLVRCLSQSGVQVSVLLFVSANLFSLVLSCLSQSGVQVSAPFLTDHRRLVVALKGTVHQFLCHMFALDNRTFITLPTQPRQQRLNPHEEQTKISTPESHQNLPSVGFKCPGARCSRRPPLPDKTKAAPQWQTSAAGQSGFPRASVQGTLAYPE